MRLLDLAPRPELAALQDTFARVGRLQVPDLLTQESAKTIFRILAQETEWGLAWQAGAGSAKHSRAAQLAAMTANDHQARATEIAHALAGDEYAFAYACYPMVEAYVESWAPDGPHAMLLEYLNDAPMMNLIRSITGMTDLVKADAQATLYAPGQFLAMHDDRDETGGRRVAYVLNLCPPGWRPEWGGYLQFYDISGDVIAGFRPKFNTLNLFAVPQAHSVTAVSPHAPVGRFAITGWFRNR